MYISLVRAGGMAMPNFQGSRKGHSTQDPEDRELELSEEH